jgi:Leucine-rich repeat (LRR) protein
MYKAESNKKKLDLTGQNLQMVPRIGSEVESLIADNNYITSLSNLPESLKFLSLSRNKIAFLGNLDSQVPCLQKLNLSGNRLISLEGISACVWLQELRLANNYVGDDQITLLQNLKELKVLDVSHNHLRDNGFLNILEKLTNLEELLNSANDFNEWVIDFSMHSLKKIVLDSNKIRNIEFKAEIPALQVISCKENNIVTVQGIAFAPLLTEVDLSGNDLSELSDSWSKLFNLKVLILKKNSLTSLPKLMSLEVLDASHNALSSLKVLSSNLRELYINHNAVTDLPTLPSLTTADISYNKLENLSFFTNSYNLKSLNASYNLLNDPDQIQKQLSNCNLVLLDLRGMDFTQSCYEKYINSFNSLEMLNGQTIMHKEESLKNYGGSLRASHGWDHLSKSKLFPSCTSSLNDVEKNTFKDSVSDYPMFSDIKPGVSEKSSIEFVNYNKKEIIEDRPETFTNDVEYELLSKELEIKKRIKQLDVQTRNLGDSLISKKESDMNAPEYTTYGKKILERNIKDLGDSLISLKESIESKNVTNPNKDQDLNRKKEDKYYNSTSFFNKFSYEPSKEEKVQGKDDNTISFEISNEISGDKPSREPLKRIYSSHQRKKSRCCKHCCKKRNKSPTLKLMRESNPKLPKFIDQATSPVDSLMYQKPLESQTSYTNFTSDFSNIGPKNCFYIDSDTRSKSTAKILNSVPMSSQRNRSFISEAGKEPKSPVSVLSQRPSSSLISYRDTGYKSTTPDLAQLINYASTPPRPILASEANLPLQYLVSTKGTEFFLVSQVFINEHKQVKKVVKTYTYSLQKNIQLEKPESFLHKVVESENILLYYNAPLKELETLCSASQGFSAIYKNNYKSLLFASNVSQIVKANTEHVLIVLASSKSVFQVRDNLYQAEFIQKIVPVYLVEFYM